MLPALGQELLALLLTHIVALDPWFGHDPSSPGNRLRVKANETDPLHADSSQGARSCRPAFHLSWRFVLTRP